MTLPQQIPEPKLGAVTVVDDDVGHHLAHSRCVLLEVAAHGWLGLDRVGHASGQHGDNKGRGGATFSEPVARCCMNPPRETPRITLTL